MYIYLETFAIVGMIMFFCLHMTIQTKRVVVIRSNLSENIMDNTDGTERIEIDWFEPGRL